jgi:hypothetical protein
MKVSSILLNKKFRIIFVQKLEIFIQKYLVITFVNTLKKVSEIKKLKFLFKYILTNLKFVFKIKLKKNIKIKNSPHPDNTNHDAFKLCVKGFFILFIYFVFIFLFIFNCFILFYLLAALV